MTAGSGRRRTPSWVGVLLVAWCAATAAADTAGIDVRLRSGVGAGTTVTLQTAPDARVLDRTPGAQKAAKGQGPASVGVTFTDEIALDLPGYVVGRTTLVDVHDALVSAVRVQPEEDGATVAIAVRQPVTYSVSRPSASGEITVELRPRTSEVSGSDQRKSDPTLAKPRDPDEVSVDAETLSFDQNTNTLVARGGVTITRGPTTLRADEVHYDRTNSIVDAKGHVVVIDSEGTVEGDSAHVVMEDETGWIDAAHGEMEPNGYVLDCDRLEKRGGPLYGVFGGNFTTCKCGGLSKPDWSLRGATADVKLDGIALLKNATFRVKDVPILWFPAFPFPANSDRASGLLFPRLSYSKRRGFQYEQPFYWAIDKSRDATIAVDLETNARIGVIGEYRYALSETASGAFTGAYFNEALRKDSKQYPATNPAGTEVTVGEDRFAVAGMHRQPLPGGGKFYLDMLAVSDDAFLREVNTFSSSPQQEGALRSTRFTTSKTGILKTWTQGYVQAELRYNQDLINPQELTPQRLPRIEGEQSLPLLGNRVVARLAGHATDYQRIDAYDGLRFHVAPDLFIPLPIGPYFAGSVTGRLRETAYQLTDRGQFAVVQPFGNCVGCKPSHFRVAPELPNLDASRSQFTQEVNARLSSEIGRVYTFESGKLRHTIEPELRYLWVPNVDRPIDKRRLRSCTGLRGEVPGDNCNATLFSEGYLFDREDAVNHRNFASWGVSTRLFWRDLTDAERSGSDDDSGTTPGSRELFRASLTHGYDLSTTRHTIVNKNGVVKQLTLGPHQSDVDVGVRLSPFSWLTMRYDSTVDFADRKIRGDTIALGLHEPNYQSPTTRNFQIPAGIEVRYGFIADSVNRLTDPDVAVQNLLSRPGSHSVGTNAYLRLGDYFGVFGTASYDFNNIITATKAKPGFAIFPPHFVDWSVFLRVISPCDCWVVDVGVHERTNEQPLDDRQFRVQFTLFGLGSVGRGASANYLGFGPAGQQRNGLLGGGF